MDETIEELVWYLCERYGVFAEEAYALVYSEWEYVERQIEASGARKRVYDRIAKHLIHIYMVA
ncbi:hypothetical protein [Hydrogenimonas sp.]